MNIKGRIFRERVLILAIVFSAVWHIFWLSAFKVSVTPKIKRPVKFSSVAFLGPILDRGMLNVDSLKYERTAREAAYLAYMGTAPALLPVNEAISGLGILPQPDIPSEADEEEFTALAVSKMDTPKIEPGRETG
jgi:hypothetical protein